MLMISGMPSHEQLIEQILRKQIHLVPNNPAVAQLTKLIEGEDSPFNICKLGREALDKAIECMPKLQKYSPFIKKTLAIRML